MLLNISLGSIIDQSKDDTLNNFSIIWITMQRKKYFKTTYRFLLSCVEIEKALIFNFFNLTHLIEDEVFKKTASCDRRSIN